jgi:hypothetical protein
MHFRRHAFVTVTAFGIVSSTAAFAAADNVQDPSADWNDVSKRIEELVKHYYPKAQFAASQNAIHFEYKVKEENGYYGESIVPMPGGILGDIELKKGEPVNSSTSPQERRDGSTNTTRMSMDLYSHKCQSHLLSNVTYPTKDAPEFRNQLSAIVAQFKCAPPPAAPAAPVAPVAPIASQRIEPTASTGPFLKERQTIRDLIEQASKKGKNVTNYQAGLKYLEERIQAGAPEGELDHTVTQLVTQLDDDVHDVKHAPIVIQHVDNPANAGATPTGGDSKKSAAEQYTAEYNWGFPFCTDSKLDRVAFKLSPCSSQIPPVKRS